MFSALLVSCMLIFIVMHMCIVQRTSLIADERSYFFTWFLPKAAASVLCAVLTHLRITHMVNSKVLPIAEGLLHIFNKESMKTALR